MDSAVVAGQGVETADLPEYIVMCHLIHPRLRILM